MQTTPPVRLAVYKSKGFARFARKSGISDESILEAAERASNGQIDADLGEGVIKQRIARKGSGRSGGARAIILFCKEGRQIFAYGFEKKDQENISRSELLAFRTLAAIYFGFSEIEMASKVMDGALIRVASPAEDQHGDKIPQ